MSTDGTLTETHDAFQINAINSPDSGEKIQREVIPGWKKSNAPDGGLAAWSVVLGSWCVLFCTFGWINSTNKPLPPRSSNALCTILTKAGVGAFQNYYESTLLSQYSASTIAWIPSLQIFFMYAMVGSSDALSSLVLSFIICSFSTRAPCPAICTTTMDPVIQFYSDRFFTFSVWWCVLYRRNTIKYCSHKAYVALLESQSSSNPVSKSFQWYVDSNDSSWYLPTILATSVIPGWFDNKRGTAYGLMSTGSSVGGVIFPIMIQRLIPEVGFAWAMRAGAFVILFLLTIANLTIRSRLPPSPRPVSRAALIQPLKETKMLLVIAGFTLLTFGVYIPINYLVVEGLASGISTNLSQYLLAILNAGRYVWN